MRVFYPLATFLLGTVATSQSPVDTFAPDVLTPIPNVQDPQRAGIRRARRALGRGCGAVTDHVNEVHAAVGPTPRSSPRGLARTRES